MRVKPTKTFLQEERNVQSLKQKSERDQAFIKIPQKSKSPTHM